MRFENLSRKFTLDAARSDTTERIAKLISRLFEVSSCCALWNSTAICGALYGLVACEHSLNECALALRKSVQRKTDASPKLLSLSCTQRSVPSRYNIYERPRKPTCWTTLTREFPPRK